MDGVKFVGVNGVDNEEAMKFLTDISFMEVIKDVSVLVSHVPPYGFQDKVFLGMHSGSKILRELVDTYKPRLVLCGHIHEDPGVTKYNDTFIVNCSMGKRGAGACISLKDKISVEMLD
jgi:Icc-related predicted phosphoesterase